MNRPIGLFDSGFGGLTVMKELTRLLPNENIIYLGDTAHLPYGDKSPETVLQYALDNSSFLLEKNIKLLMIPCHTACCHALEVLQQKLSIKVIGVIEAGIHLIQKFDRIAILGTTSTIESGIYQKEISKKNPKAKIIALPCPLFVPLVEEGFHNHPAAHLIAESYLSPIKGEIDAALLACTHYPLIRPLIQTILGPTVTLVEPALACAEEAKRYLIEHNLLNDQKQAPTYQFYATDNPQKFCRLGKIFLGSEIQENALPE
jgi:glutamate racemase